MFAQPARAQVDQAALDDLTVIMVGISSVLGESDLYVEDRERLELALDAAKRHALRVLHPGVTF